MKQLPIIELIGVDYRQGDTQILCQVRWKLRPGQHWAVLGPNGSGKTTLLRIACGYLWPSAGNVLRMGQELVNLRELRRQIGWITNDLPSRVPPNDTALETVVTGRLAQVGIKYLLGTSPTDQDFSDAEAMLRSLNCEHLAEKPFGVLSQGERQQVLVGRARMAEPLLLVLDEPCAGMDPGVRERFLSWLNHSLTSSDGPTVVLVTHHVEEIVPGIGQTLIMCMGRILSAGPTADVVTQSTIEAVYQTKLARLEKCDGRLWPIWGK